MTASQTKQRAAVARLLELVGPYAGQRTSFTTGSGAVEMLVATVLSQNTNDRNSHQAFRLMRKAYPTWRQLAAADPQELAAVIRVGGLARQKAHTITGALKALWQRHGTFNLRAFRRMTDQQLLDELTAIPGVGLKTAACVLMFALGRDVCPVDTHVHRVVNRVGVVSAATPDKSFVQLRGLIPAGQAPRLHAALIRFGRHVCKARLPHCFQCPAYNICGWELKKEHAENARAGARPVSGDFLLMDNLR